MKEPKSNGKTMKQLLAYLKSAKGKNKVYWSGYIKAFKGSARYQLYLKSLKAKKKKK